MKNSANICVTSGGLTTASTIVLLASIPGAMAAETSPAQNQLTEATPTAQAQASEGLEELVVTGSRVLRNGYQAPTPVTVLGEDELNAMAQPNIADAINRLPQFDGSTRPQNSATTVSGGTGGVNTLNLRGIGATRTLVLLDGKRVVGASLNGAVDINSFPSALVSRVDVVTGGASAAYGSDALTGVVNFIIDKNFTGIKGSIEGGITTYGDNGSYKVSGAFGTGFAGDRGHILVFGEGSSNDGIPHNNRSWGKNGFQTVVNPNYHPGNGAPQYLTVEKTGLVNATPGGLITSGPLQGTQFVQGGTPVPFQYGSLISGNLMQGGDWQTSRIDNETPLDLSISRVSVFTRLNYHISDSINAYAEFGWADTSDDILTVPNYIFGTQTVLSGNPFIPASVQARMTALGLPSFTLGTLNRDAPDLGSKNDRIFRHYVGGFEGTIEAGGSGWNWDVYYDRSTENVSARAPNDRIKTNYSRAVDAVLDPATGRVVCRSTLTTPNDGCVPYNPMGINVNSAQAIGYSFGTSFYTYALSQDVLDASVTGNPFSTWAGPVSVAFGGAYRREAVDGTSSALDTAGAFFAGNGIPTKGAYNVKEGFIETVLPLAKNESWADSLELNGAVRATDYSESGFVATWKVGATYTPTTGISIRTTRSRDIRAPNLGDLFTTGNRSTINIIDPVLNKSYLVFAQAQGNRGLKPEKADTTGVGVILTPSWLKGFGASVDFYNIDINGAIQSLSPQQDVTNCFQGAAALCDLIERDASGAITTVFVRPANITSQHARGLDIEASYHFPLSDISKDMHGDLAFRGFGNYAFSLKSTSPLGTSEGAGVVADLLAAVPLNAPRFRWNVATSYSNGPFVGTLMARGISSGVYNNAFIECQTLCPTATAAAPTINDNHVDAIVYFDLSLNYKFFNDTTELFFATENIFDRDPPLVAGTVNQGYSAGQSSFFNYDRAGRTFHLGIRFRK